MPPKSTRGPRPTRASARKSVPTKCATSRKPDEQPNDVDLIEVYTRKSITQSPPPPENPSFDSPAPEKPSEPTIEADEVPKETEASLPQNDVVMGSAVVNDEIEDCKKGKKMVKKTVKVIKKVIKKVPKKAVMTKPPSPQHGNSADIPNPSSTISGGVAVEPADVEPEDALLNAENFDLVPVMIEVKAGIVEKEEDGLPVQVEEEAQIDEKNDGLEDKEETVERNLMEEQWKIVKEKYGLEGKDMKVGESMMEVDNNVEATDSKCGAENVDAEGKEEIRDIGEKDTSHGVVKEDDTGEGKLFRGELEAMERKKRRRTEIFIGGLDKDAKEEDIRKVFSEVGEIVEVRVVMNAKTGKNKGYAFLRYASVDDATKALEKFAKVEICGKQCGATPAVGNDTIFLGNIDKKWKDDDVLKLLQEAGIEQIDKVTVMIDPIKSECNRGFAFVEFLTSKDAVTAHRKLQKNDVFGKSMHIKVAWAEPLKDIDDEEMLKVKTVYAEFIPSSWNEEKLRDTFKNFGEIDDIVLARNLKTTKRKDFAFIYYKTREAAIKCIESFDGELKEEDGTKVNLKVSLAKPMERNKKQKPVSKSVAKEAPKKKQKTNHSNLWPSEQRSRVQPAIPRYGAQIADRSSTNAELVQLLREQASWRPSEVNLSNVAHPMDLRYPNLVLGGRHQHPMLEADPRRPDMGRYSYPRLDAPFPVASSSRTVMPLAPSGLPSSLAYHQQHSGYPSATGSLYGAANYPGYTETRGNPHGSSYPYHRY